MVAETDREKSEGTMKNIITLISTLLANPVLADGVMLPPSETERILSEGRILSTAAIYTERGLDSAVPINTRIHEAFILWEGNVYLCHMVGSRSSGTRPYAGCYGYRRQ